MRQYFANLTRNILAYSVVFERWIKRTTAISKDITLWKLRLWTIIKCAMSLLELIDKHSMLFLCFIYLYETRAFHGNFTNIFFWFSSANKWRLIQNRISLKLMITTSKNDLIFLAITLHLLEYSLKETFVISR